MKKRAEKILGAAIDRAGSAGPRYSLDDTADKLRFTG